jgi:hypothetical protein
MFLYPKKQYSEKSTKNCSPLLSIYPETLFTKAARELLNFFVFIQDEKVFTKAIQKLLNFVCILVVFYHEAGPWCTVQCTYSLPSQLNTTAFSVQLPGQSVQAVR